MYTYIVEDENITEIVPIKTRFNQRITPDSPSYIPGLTCGDKIRTFDGIVIIIGFADSSGNPINRRGCLIEFMKCKREGGINCGKT